MGETDRRSEPDRQLLNGGKFMDEVTETLVVTFESEDHKKLHDVMIRYHLTFQVDQALRVGRTYFRPKKPIKVFIKDGDNYLETWSEVSGTVMTDKDYSVNEFKWMCDGLDSTIVGEAVYLERELNILINVRPHFMSQALM